MHGYEALADALVQEGVDTVFTVLAEDILKVMLDLTRKRGVKMISARHEQGAGGMAEGYSLITGKPGVCLVTAGPGLVNTAAALTLANRSRSQVLCITTTSVPNSERHNPKTSDQRLVAEGTAGKYIRVRQPETLAEDIQLAFRYIRSRPGPAVLAIPQDIMEGELDLVWEYSPAATRMPMTRLVNPMPETIDRAAAMLAEAQRPVILAGRGAIASKSEAEIRSLAERTGALIATTLRTKGYLGDHPYNVGVAGAMGTDLARSLLPESDCVLAVGASLNVYTTQFGFLFPQAKFIQVDQDPDQIGETTPVSLGIVGDACATLAAINARVGERQAAGRQGFWNTEVRSRISDARTQPAPAYVVAPDTIDPRELVAEMDRLLPKERLVLIDGGQCAFFVISGLSDAVVNCGLDFACVGMGLSRAIGVAVGRPDRHVVLFAGDGGFMMSLEELDTAVRHGIPMTIVVMNDSAFGAEVVFLEIWGMPTDIARFANLEFAEVAKALGAVGLTARNAEEIRAAESVIGKGNRPVLIDAKTNLSVVHEMWRGKATWEPNDFKLDSQQE